MKQQVRWRRRVLGPGASNPLSLEIDEDCLSPLLTLVTILKTEDKMR
jgi:hypothetical protein